MKDVVGESWHTLGWTAVSVRLPVYDDMATPQAPDALLIDEEIGAGNMRIPGEGRGMPQEFLWTHEERPDLLFRALELFRAICTRALLLSNDSRVFLGNTHRPFDRHANMPRGAAA